jgi:hypothetical protein
MKMKYLIVLFAGISIWMVSCVEDQDYNKPIVENKTVPQNVTDEISYESLPGAVKLKYQLPTDLNVAQVRARYTLSTGVERTVASSVYTKFIILDGFSDTLLHDVVIYTVSKSNVNSDTKSTKVKAMESAIWKVQKSLKFPNQFGGFNIEGVNTDTSVVSIFVMDKNDFGEFEVNNFKSFATNFPKITRKIRGLDTTRYEFRYFVMDRWNNSTDTVTQYVDPLYEASIPKSGYKGYRLPGDAPQVTNGSSLEAAWDGRYFWPYTSFTSQELGGKTPHMVTIDMGLTVQLSRFWYRPYPEFWGDPTTIQYFYLTAMREFEVYGSVAPNVNGQLDSTWVLMGQFEVEKPSGSSYGNDTPEDIAYAEAGINFEFDVILPKVRYIRIRCLRNWADGTAQNINELEFFGDPRVTN